MIPLEVCASSIEGVRAAERGGAQRIELCSALEVGGTTPPAGLLRIVRRTCPLALVVLVRPRAGGFVYSEAELDVLRGEVDFAGQCGADAVALGVLRADGCVDAERTAELVERAKPMQATFHRAFDEAPDPMRALEEVIATGCTRLLTSGGAPTAIEGARLLRELVEQAGERITILAGGGVRSSNVASLVATSRVREVHSSARSPRGGEAEEGEVRAIVAALRAMDSD